MTKDVKGIIASQGISIGEAYIFNKTQVEVNTGKIDDTDIAKEEKRFLNTIKKYKKELDERKTNSDEEKAVIDAHKELISDPYLIDTVRSKINEDKVFADYALDETIKEMVSMMESLDDEYLKERATDYKDIGERLLYIINDVNAANISNLDKEYIIISKELTPTDTSTMDKDKVLGFAMDLGGKTSHTSIIAQTLSIPALVGTKSATKKIKNGDILILDAFKGIVIINPDNETLESYKTKLKQLSEEKDRLDLKKHNTSYSKDGKRVEVACNIGNLEDLEIGINQGAEGVGLFRTEFLYMESDGFPSEEMQFEVYKEAAEMLKGRPLVIRTLDIGGDKGLDYFEFPKEENPFLGWRALRISFDLEDMFKEQLKAILRAGYYGNVKILLPMIISVEELLRVQDLIEICKEELEFEGKEYGKDVEVGVMIETPASVLMAGELIQYCDYFSIGTNDLTQYTLAVDRGNENISNLYDYYHPAVLRSIKQVIDASHQAGKWTGMCGSMASDTLATYLLFGMGLDEFSAAASQIPKIKDIISKSSLDEAQEFAREILNCSRLDSIKEKIKKRNN